MTAFSEWTRTRDRLAIVDLIAYVVLAFAIGLATALVLAGAVLLLAHDAQAAEAQQSGQLKPMKRAQAEALPACVPDLYLGKPIVISAALDKMKGDVRLHDPRDGGKEDDVRQAVVKIADADTSFVAADKAPVWPFDAEMRSGAVPTDRREGWEFEKVFGELPQGASNARWRVFADLLTMLFGIALFVTAPAPAGGPERALT